ncbi:MAG TPA: 1,4-alpha-glucan branching protein GlgB [Actinomycetota bacterium]|nr:1,4-alpha-glucan branching protein GlgB [Actinomycetota bacterium]
MTRTEARPQLSDDDLYLFGEGTHARLAAKLGAHPASDGTSFAVWAPNASTVSVVGDFNGWDREADPMEPVASSGIWKRHVVGAAAGQVYKFHVRSRVGNHRVEKADPLAFRAETPPKTGSVIWDLAYEWGDRDWIARRREPNALSAPQSVYEVHLGSWRRSPDGGWLGYREVAEPLADHALDLRFTHVELLPVMEHPFYGSWGYQTTGYFAPTARYGTPQDLMFLIDHLHQRGLGVILDWVPSHFPADEHGLAYFDGTHLYEHADPRRGYHPDWHTLIFNYGRNEVRSFLLSSADHWVRAYHADGLRVDAVASMLYLDYSRKEGEWLPNRLGGRENLEAVSFVRRLNEDVYREHAGVQTTAEESTAWPMVSRPTDVGGLGFGFKWDMGWMHDTLQHLRRDPIHRRYHYGELTFRQVYAYSENFVLPLSHDEVVHGKGSLLGKMPGDDWQRFANLRLLLGYQWAQPGKKLIFMGGELAQTSEWDHDAAVHWDLRDDPRHRGVLEWVRDLNALYRREPALHAFDVDPRGFEWIEASDAEGGVLAFLRLGSGAADVVAVVCNLTPTPHERYRLGLPSGGTWRELLNGDAERYGGSGMGNLGRVTAMAVPWHGREHSARIVVPPLACVFLKPAGEVKE